MAKRAAYLHIGPTHSGSGFLPQALATHRDALALQGVRCPAKSADETFRAAVEIRRVHRAWGYRRREVEGTWSAICRRAHKGRGPVVLSEPHLAAAEPDEIALLLDRLDGFDVHVIVTAPPPQWPAGSDSGPDLTAVVTRWTAALRGPGRMHVVTPPAGDPAAFLWSELGRIVGFDPVGLALPEGADPLPTPDQSPAELLVVVLDELERQRVRNNLLQARNEELARTRKKLKRRLAGTIAG